MAGFGFPKNVGKKHNVIIVSYHTKNIHYIIIHSLIKLDDNTTPQWLCKFHWNSDPHPLELEPHPSMIDGILLW